MKGIGSLDKLPKVVGKAEAITIFKKASQQVLGKKIIEIYRPKTDKWDCHGQAS